MEEAIAYLRTVLHRALSEDIGHADVTTAALADHHGRVRAEILHRSGGVVAGIFCVNETLTAAARFLGLDDDFEVHPETSDGAVLVPGSVIARIDAEAGLLLPAERVMLNFLARLSGIAASTRRFVNAVQGTEAHIYDTRKTTPLLRPLEKYAVRAGGGCNHRAGLYEQILIKDNHLRLSAVSIEDALRAAKDYAREAGLQSPVEIEVEDLTSLRDALSAGADIVMLDNMPLEVVRQAVALRDSATPGTLLEVSGGVTLENVRDIAETGVERISIGAITHSAPAADIALEFSP